MRLGLYGGTFDPVHYAHLLLAESCREQCQLDEVCFLPAAVPPHKQGSEITSGRHRLAMLELATAGEPAFSISDYEIQRGGVNYTVQTLRHFREVRPDADLFFLMGADMLHDLPNWRDASDVCRLALPVVVQRAGAGPLDLDCLATIASPERIEEIRRHLVEMPQMSISATDLRRRVAEGRSIRYQTPRAVEMYIREEGLYRTGEQGTGDRG